METLNYNTVPIQQITLLTEVYILGMSIPDANPWYAKSKNGNSFFCWTTLEISIHCSGLGSTPVGLCAQAWNKIIDFSGIF